jgi:ferric-dicitrate binding protein FerR (iron transport regulator)
MGAGLVLFGIGSDVSGGLGDLFRDGGGGQNQAEEATQKRIDAAETTLQTDPDNRAALEQVVSGHFQLASAKANPETSEFTDESRPELLKAAAAWKRYQKAVDKPNPTTARQAIQAYDGLGRFEAEAADAAQYWEGAAGAAEAAATVQPRAQNYILLVQYATWAGQTRKAELAGQKAIELAPKSQKQQAKQAVQQAKAIPPPQQGQPGQGAPAAPQAP